MSTPQRLSYPLTDLPPGAKPRGVTAAPITAEHRDVLRVQLSEEVTQGRPGVDYVDIGTPHRVREPDRRTDELITRSLGCLGLAIR